MLWYRRCVDDVSLSIAHHEHAPNWVAEHLGAFPALMAGVTPGRVPVYTALKNHPVKPRRAENCNCGETTVFCTSGPHALSEQQRACYQSPRTAPVNDHHDDHVTVQIHLPLLTATLVLQLEPGIVVVVWANIVEAAEPVIQHANSPNELMILEIIDEVFSSHRLHTVPNRIVSTPELDDCNVGARLSSPHLHSETGPAQQEHRSPYQCTATGEFL